MLFHGFKADIKTTEMNLPKHETDVIKAVHEIAKIFLANHWSDISIVYPRENELLSDFIVKLSSEIHCTAKLLIESSEKLAKLDKVKRSAAIFVMVNFESFQSLYQKWSNRSLFQRNGHFLIIFLKANREQMKAIFDLLWKVHVYNVGIIHVDNHGAVKLSTFLPFLDGCGDTTPQVINDFDADRKAWKSLNFFPSKCRNLNGCVIKIGTFETAPSIIREKRNNKTVRIYGSEIATMNGIGQLMSFKPFYRFYEKDSGLIFDNGSSTGLMRQALEGDSNLIMGFLSLQYSRAKVLSYTEVFAYVPIAIVVPPGDFISPFNKLIYPFSAYVWILMVVMFLLAFAIITVTKIFSRKVYFFLIGEGVESPVLNMFLICLGLAQNKLPRRNFARFTLMNLMLFFLVMRTCYQGILFQLLRSDVRESEVSSIDEMLKRDFKFYVYESLEKRTEGYAFYNKRVVIKLTNVDDYRDKTLDPQFKGAVFNYLSQVLYLNQLNYKTFTYRICKEKFTTSQILFYFQKDFYLLDDFNHFMAALHQSGLINYWRSKFIDVRFSNIKEVPAPASLTFFRLLGSVQVWTVGIALGALVFAVELSGRYLKFIRKLFT